MCLWEEVYKIGVGTHLYQRLGHHHALHTTSGYSSEELISFFVTGMVSKVGSPTSSSLSQPFTIAAATCLAIQAGRHHV